LSSSQQSSFDNSKQLLYLPASAEFIDPRLLDRRLNPSPELSQAPLQNYYPSNASEQTHNDSLFTSPPQPLQDLSHSSFDTSLGTDVGADQVQQSSVADTPFQSSNVSPFTCLWCQETFSKNHELNRHTKKHTLDFKCQHPSCPTIGFRYKKDLQRHYRSKHPGPDQPRFYCLDVECKFSERAGVGFARKDHWQRHLDEYRNKPHSPPKSSRE